MIIKKIFIFEVSPEDELNTLSWTEAMEKFKDNPDGWRLPTIEELNLMYQNKDKIKGLTNAWYWSASESNYHYARFQYFSNGYQDWYHKDFQLRVRCVRSVQDE